MHKGRDRQTERQIDKEVKRGREREKETHTGTGTGRERERERERNTHRDREREIKSMGRGQDKGTVIRKDGQACMYSRRPLFS